MDKATFHKLISLVNKGRVFTKRKRYKKALCFYEEAKSCFSEPLSENTGAETLYILIGDTYFEYGDFENARKYYIKSQDCIDKSQLSISLFKIGKSYFEENKLLKAKECFLQVYKESDKKYFLSEDVKYYRLVQKLNQNSEKEEFEKIEKLKNQTYKIYKGKKYTKEEWQILEQQLFEEYVRKNKR